MGQRIALSCKDCGLHKELSLGVGLMTNKPDVIASCLNKEDAAEWKNLYDQKKIASFQAQQKAYYCPYCNDVSAVFCVEAELTDGRQIVLGEKCRKCHGGVQEILMQKRRPCPVCKGGNFSWQEIGYWD